MPRRIQPICIITVRMRGWYVYAHLVAGRIVYIGSGKSGRPFNITSRSDQWVRQMRSARSFDVVVLRWFSSKKDATEAEASLIARHNPELNTRGKGMLVMTHKFEWEP